MDELNRKITQLRGEASEESLEQATALEQEFEKDLAKNASDDELQRRGYDADELRKAHRSQGKREGGAKSEKEKED